MCTSDFFVRNLMLKNFYFKRFLILLVILAALSPKLNILSHFRIIKYLKDINLMRSLAPILGER